MVGVRVEGSEGLVFALYCAGTRFQGFLMADRVEAWVLKLRTGNSYRAYEFSSLNIMSEPKMGNHLTNPDRKALP